MPQRLATMEDLEVLEEKIVASILEGFPVNEKLGSVQNHLQDAIQKLEQKVLHRLDDWGERLRGVEDGQKKLEQGLARVEQGLAEVLSRLPKNNPGP